MDGVEGVGKEREKEQKELIWLQLCLSMIVCFSFELILNTLSTRLLPQRAFHSSFFFRLSRSLSRWYFVQIDKANVEEKHITREKRVKMSQQNAELIFFPLYTHIEARFTMHIKHAT